MSSDFSSIVDYPVPQNLNDAGPPTADSDVMSTSEAAFQLSQMSLLLNPSFCVEDSQINESEQRSLHTAATVPSIHPPPEEATRGVMEVPQQCQESHTISPSKEVELGHDWIQESERMRRAPEKCNSTANPVEGSSQHSMESANNISHEISSHVVFSPPNDPNKSQGKSGCPNKERNFFSSTKRESSKPRRSDVTNTTSTPLSQKANDNSGASPVNNDCFRTPILPKDLPLKSFSASKTFTGATVSPTPEKSVCSDGSSNRTASSRKVPLPDEYLAVQYLDFGGTDENETSLYSC